MSDNEFTVLFPKRWSWSPYSQLVIQEIVLNWLDVEVDPVFVAQHPILAELSGWRMREVWNYVRNYDWTERLYTESEKTKYILLSNDGKAWRDRQSALNSHTETA